MVTFHKFAKSGLLLQTCSHMFIYNIYTYIHTNMHAHIYICIYILLVTKNSMPFLRYATI